MTSRQRKAFMMAAAVSVVGVQGISFKAMAASATWNGAADTFWANPNWSTGANNAYTALANDSLFFDATATTGNVLNNNFAADTAFSNLTFNSGAGPYTLNGNTILLSGTTPGPANGVTNASSNVQTVNLGLDLNWGVHAFSSPAGSIAVNGAVNAYAPAGSPVLRGGLANFGSNITSTSLTQDANTGLIAGLNGAALAANANGTFTGLATVSGGAIVPYTFSDANAQVLNGTAGHTAIVSNTNSNVNLTNTTATTFTIPAGTVLLNTISNAGATTGNRATITLAGGQTVRFGTVGGLFLSGGGTNVNVTNVITIGGAGVLTAGGANPNTPGELIFDVNSTGTNNNFNISNSQNGSNSGPAIVDNGSGAVTVIKGGSGSMFIQNSSSYTGGTYINEGYLQVNAVGGFGTGPVFIAPNATAFPNPAAAGVIPNDFTISPGLGYSANVGALKINQSDTMPGKITLMGPAGTTVGSGDRITLGTNNGILSFTGQITGPGALELAANNTTGNFILNNATANPSNYSGGLIVDNVGNDNTIVKLGADNQIPDGASAGDVLISYSGSGATGDRLDLNGHNDTINGLNSPGDSHNQVTNGAAATSSVLTIGANNASGSFGGVISGGGTTTLSIVKTGTGTQTFAGANTYAGNTSIVGGSLVVTGSLASPNINVQNGTFVANNGSALANNAVVTLGSGATSGVLDLAGNSPTFAGLSTSGTGAGNIVGSSTSSSTVNLSGGSTVFGGVIQDTLPGGSGQLSVNQSAGTITFSGANTYTGDTTIGGAVIVTGSLASTGNVNLNNGTLAGTGNGTTTGKVGNVTLNGGTIRPGASPADGNVGLLTMASLTVNSGELRFDLNTTSNADQIIVTNTANFAGSSSITFSSIPSPGTYTLLSAGALQGTAPTPPAGSGNSRTTLALHFGDATSGANNMTLAVSGSPLNITWTGANGNAWDLHNTINWTDATNGPDKYFDLDSPVFGDGPTNRTVQLDTAIAPSSVTFANSAGNDYTIQGGGGIGDSGLTGGTSLNVTGGGNVTLATNNSYLGATNIQNGTLILNAGSALPNNTALRLGSGATSGAVDVAGNNITVTELSTPGGSSNVIGNSGASQSTINYNGGSSTFNGIIQDTFGGNGTSNVALTLNSGTLILAGNSTYTGPTNINSNAALQLGNGGSTGSVTLANVNNNGTLIFNHNNTIVITDNLNGGGATQINSGTVQVGNGAGNGTLNSGAIVNNGTLIFDRGADTISIPNTISGSGVLRLQGAGTLTLSGPNTYTGNTIIESGEHVFAGSNTAFGATVGGGTLAVTGGGSVTVQNGAALDVGVGNGVALGAKPIFVEGSGPDGNGALLNSGNTAQGSAFQNVTLTGDATFNMNARADIRGSQAQGVVSGTLNLNGNTLTKIGGGSLTFAAINVTDGNVAVDAGTVSVEGATKMLDNGNGKTFTINATSGDVAIAFFQNTTNNGTISRPMVFNNLGGSPDIVNPANSNAVSIASSGTLNGAATFNVTQQLTWAGNLNDGTVAGSINKISTGTLILSGANGYTGGTNINGGTLVTNTNFSNGTLNLSSGVARVTAQSTNNSAAGRTVVPAVSISGGSIDLTNNAMIVDYAPGNSPLTTIRGYLNSGYNGGAWNGNGLASSSAAATSAAAVKTALGYAEASALPSALPAGFVDHDGDNSSLIVKYALFGDANLDGTVNALDFNALATNFGNNSGANVWTGGDFTYDGNVDTNDFTAMAQNFGGALAAPALTPVLGALVPEPGTLAVLACSVFGLLGRRRRCR